MSKKEEFKAFAKNHPELVSKVHQKDASWQELYEIYDIYGEDTRAWNKYLKESSTSNLSNLSDIVKKIDMDTVQKHISTAQKALDLVQELTNKTPTNASFKGPANPRPINHFFED